MRFTAALLLAASVAACGSSGPGLSETAAEELQPRVQAVREAAVTGDRAAAEERLAELRSVVDDLHDREELSDAARERVTAAVHDVATELAVLPTTTQPSPPPPPAGGDAVDGDGDDDEQGGEGRGKGRDGGGGEEKEEEEKRKEEEEKKEKKEDDDD